MRRLHWPERLVARTGRAWRRGRFHPLLRRGRPRDFLFVSGPGGGARRYRCDHQAEQLRMRSRSADVGYWDELDVERLVSDYRTIVLYRVPWDDRVGRVVDAAERQGALLLADVDDLVFDPARAAALDELRTLAPEARAARQQEMAQLRETISRVGGVAVSTEPLAAAATGTNDRVAVTYNAVSQAMIRMAGRARRSTGSRGAPVIAYLSGTATHDRDFLAAADAVLWALERHRTARFWAVGFLTLDERFERFGDRVARFPYRPWRRLPRLLASIDVNLAPLELENEFTDAKSCLKYLEAALLGVPTIASPTADFRRAITSGENGVLARGDDEWRAALEELLSSAERRQSIGGAARNDVLMRHSTRARAAATTEAFASLVDAMAD